MATIKDLLNKMIDKINGIPEIKEDVSQLSLDIATKITAPATAEVGQTIVVSEVDENGKPTAWEMADMVSGEDWELIIDYTVEENCGAVSFTEDMNGKPFNLKKAMLIVRHFAPVLEDGTFGDNMQLKAMLYDFRNVRHENGKLCFSKAESAIHFTSLIQNATKPEKVQGVSTTTILTVEKRNGLVHILSALTSSNGNSLSYHSKYADGIVTYEQEYMYGKLIAQNLPYESFLEMNKIVNLHVGGIYNSIGKGSRIIMYGVRE